MVNELTNYIERLNDLRNQVISLISNVPEQGLNWRPIEDMDSHITNSLAALTNHIAGAEHFWIAEAIGGWKATRDREAEFATVAGSPEIILNIYKKTAQETSEVLSKLNEMDLNNTRQVRDRIVPVRWCILHVIDHTSLHLGHMQITYQLWTGGKSFESPLWMDRLPKK